MEEENKTRLEKQILLKNIALQVRMRKLILPLLAIVLLFFNVFSPPVASTVLGSILVLFSFSLFFFAALYVKKTPSLSLSAIRQILVNIIFLELLAAWAGFYFFSFVVNSWLIPIAFPASLLSIFYLVLISPLLEDLYRTFFYLISWLGLTFLILLNHSSFVESVSARKFNTDIISSSSLVSIVLAGIAIFGVRIIISSTQDQSHWQSGGLRKVNQKLQNKLEEKDESIFQLRRELRETREILQIRTLARGKELKNLTKNFQKMLSKQKDNLQAEDERRSKIQEAQETTKALLNVLEDNEKDREKLMQEEELTTTIINNFVDGLIIFDPQGIIQEVNKQAQHVFHIQENDVQKQPLAILQKYSLIAPAVKIMIHDNHVQLVKEKEFSPQPAMTMTVSIIALQGKERRLGYLAVFHDVSREKNIQKMKTDFVSIAAHQLRTPLSAIKWSIKMILDGEAGKISAKQKDWLNKTYQSNERMIALVNDLLNVSRIEEGKFLYDVQEIDLRSVIQNVLHNDEEIIKRKKMTVSFQGENKEIPKVKVDVEKIQLAIQNLVTNAIDYTPAGGKVVITLDQKGRDVLVKVKDTGIGISKEDQKKLFHRFFRARNAIQVRANGTGLGLFITKNIVQAHRGKIWFESELGKGTTFYLTIPSSQS